MNERPGLPYLPGLDGLRGLAIAAVLVFHADPRWLPGGMLGISVFFTLSGFLITSLLLVEIDRTGSVGLRAFWTRRARRLVPASLLTVALIALLAATGAIQTGRGFVGDAIASVTWSANWRFVTEGTSYGDLFGDPSPFQHFWSLAVEEQLYLVLPVLVLGLVAVLGRRRWPLGVVLVLAVALSTAAAAALHAPGQPPSRAYFGTDARIAEPLVGALLALLLVRGGGLRRLPPIPVRVVGLLGAGSLAAVAWWATETSPGDERLYRGGFLVTALLAAVVVAALTQPTPIARLLAAPPLVALGRISYGVYLLHWPLYLWLDGRLGATVAPVTLVTAQVGGSIALAAVSYTVLEQPIRRGWRPTHVFAVGWANATVAVVSVVVLAAAVPATPANAPVDLGAGPGSAAPPVPMAGDGSGRVRATGAPALAAPQPAAPATTGAGQPTGAGGPADVADDPVVGTNGQGFETGPMPTGSASMTRIAVLGDSLGHNVATGLGAWASDMGDTLVYNLTISGCPLTRGGERRFDETEWFVVDPRCAWWDDPWSGRSQNLSTFDPDVVVFEASLNELLDRRPPGWDRWIRPGDPAFHQWLLEEYDRLFDRMRQLAGEDTELLVLNAVCADFDRHPRWQKVEDTDGRVTALNKSFPLMVEPSHGDIFSEVCPNGEYREDLWGIEEARPDGIHLSDEAATELARRWLGPLIREMLEDDGTVELAPQPSPEPPPEPAPGSPPEQAPARRG